MISLQIPKIRLIRLDIFYTLGEGVIISADVQFRTRKDVTHYTRIVLDPLSLKVVKATCSCEAESFRKKCWHIKTLEQMIKDNRELRKGETAPVIFLTSFTTNL